MKIFPCKMITLILLTSLLAQLAACGEGEAQTDGTTADTVGNSVTTEAVYNPETVDLGGKEVNLFLWNLTQIATEEENGDTVNDAVYRRNAKVQELFNCKFVYTVTPGGPADYSQWSSTLTASIMADDDSVQIAGGYGYRLAALALDGNYHNLLDIPEIQLDKDWWYSDIMQAGNLGGAVYITFGHIDPLFYNTTYAMYFNKQLAEDHGVGNLYQMVRDGGWTLDKLMEISALASSDIDGNAVMDQSDKFGCLIADPWMCVDAFVDSCHIQFTEYDSDGIPSLVGLTEKYVDLKDKLEPFFYDSNDVYYDKKANQSQTIFRENRGLIMTESIRIASILRDMETDFGIIPYPKWDDAQENYRTYNAVGNSTAFMIPVTADAAENGMILEALSYYGMRDVLPEYYEKALKGKGTRDNESQEMLDIIFNSFVLDFTQVYSYNFGDQKSPSMLLRMTVLNQQDMASTWSANQSLFDETMEKLIATLK